MQRNKATYKLAPQEVGEMKRRMLNWSSRFGILLFLDNNGFASPYNRYECLMGAGVASAVHAGGPDWQFGHICYDHKNVVEPKLRSQRAPKLGFPQVEFFTPETVCYIDKDLSAFTIESYHNTEEVHAEILSCGEHQDVSLPALEFTTVIKKERYLQIIERLREHIGDGDCYEINFCNEGYCENAAIDPLRVFRALNSLSPSPFAAYYRTGDHYMMCASPERYLQKTGNRLLSQPMKGTAKRGTDAAADAAAKLALRQSVKEQAENVMITDLVRNDLAKCCKPGSIAVDELFGVYTYPTVHQMISTVSGEMETELPFMDIINRSFPMGSMTGAPKFKVMQLIDEYEYSARELFSGSVGYITPTGNFDLNVIIRSLFYNAANRYLCYQTGGAITYDSDPLQEWEETRLKAWALERIFAG